MRVSWNWLSELVDLSEVKGPVALADLLTRRGLEVESIERLDQGLEKVVTAQILERNPHPQSDRLSLCQVTTGSDEVLEIVCGAQNMKSGDKVALAQIGALLPNGLKIAQSKIRGVVSNGMLCSEEELKLKDQSEGILILPSSTPLGQPLSKILGRDDVILTLKLTANRGDCLSHFGIAREVGAALGKRPKKPQGAPIKASSSPIGIHLEAGEAAPQFLGCMIQGVQVGPSPAWVVQRLEALGSRSINNVVDASNWVMLELGHPTHAYDAKKVLGNQIYVRMSREGESLPLLDGQTISLTGAELVIADQERSIGLAGVMGGGNSEVQDQSQTLFLECAEFNAQLVRKASTRYQLKTDAAHRFERGIDSFSLSDVMARLVELIIQWSGGEVVGSSVVQVPSFASKLSASKAEISFSEHYLCDFLGFERTQSPLTPAKVEEIMRSLDCEVRKMEGEWRVVPPSYRLDLNIKEDIAEEIARSIGYDAIPATIPTLSSSPVLKASALHRITLMDRAKNALVQSGFHEAINYGFSSQSWLSQFGFTSSVKVVNPLSENCEAMVPSLIPGLVKNALDNWNHHFGSELLSIRLFELRPTFSASSVVQATGQMETGVQESWKLALLLSGPRFAEALRSDRGEVDFYDLKGMIDHLLTSLGARGMRFQPVAQSRSGGNALFHPGQSVEVLAGNSVAGYYGLLHPAVSRKFKVRSPVWLAEFDWDALTKLGRGAFEVPRFKTWPEFPSIERDFALVVKNEVFSEKICQIALKAGKPLSKVAKVFDIYRGSQVAEGMTSIAVRVIFYDEGRSLQESEAEAASARILEAWKKELGAELRN
jgi:phenylalanyl-tRNA synthetase beta chain